MPSLVRGPANSSSFLHNRAEVYSLHKMAADYSTRPSVILGLKNDYEMYCMDSAVHAFATYVDGEVEKYGKELQGDGKKKIDDKVFQRKLSAKFRKLIGADEVEEQQFATPPPPSAGV